MHPLELIDKHYEDHEAARQVLVVHSCQVAELATEVAHRLANRGEAVDISFVEEAGLLHDIGMLQTDVPEFGCNGSASYMAHGILGAKMLRGEGLPRHALVCERHIGVGLSIEDIRRERLPLPLRDMRPRSIEEMIVAYADLFFSKKRPQMKTVDQVRESLMRHGEGKAAIFDRWHKRFAV